MIKNFIFAIFALIHCQACIWAGGLPPGVPNPLGPDGEFIMKAMSFTTPAYRAAALALVLQEANQVAAQLNLPEALPLQEASLAGGYIGPYGFNYAMQCVGNVSTRDYSYCVAHGNKFSYLIGRHQNLDCQNYLATNTLPESLVDTNAAGHMAEAWLRRIAVDVDALNRDCQKIVAINHDYVMAPPGKFVPIYDVTWREPRKGTVASVLLFAPAKKILQLCVEEPNYVLRPPLVFTNLAALLTGPQSGVSQAYVDQFMACKTPTNLARAIASADRIVISNNVVAQTWVTNQIGDRMVVTSRPAGQSSKYAGYCLELAGAELKQFVGAVSVARHYPGIKPLMTGWDWQAWCYQGTKKLSVFCFQGKYIASDDEYCDDSGTVENLLARVTREAEHWESQAGPK